MPQIEQAEKGTFGVITETQDGRIVQIALTEDQSKMLQVFLSMLSTPEKPLLRLGKEYELVPVNKLCNKCKNR